MKKVVACVVVLCSLVAPSEGAPILTPPGLSPGEGYHLVFVTSAATNANFGGIAGGDAFVQGVADAAGIGASAGISWQAILSDSTTDAISRFNPSDPIYNLNGDRVAANGPALWNAATVPLENPISFDENGGGSIAIPVEVWTGTRPDGTFDTAASNWTGTAGSATAGSSVLTSGGWADGGASPSETVPLSLFASSERMVVPAAVTPEPSTLALGGVLLVAGIACAWWRRAGYLRILEPHRNRAIRRQA